MTKCSRCRGYVGCELKDTVNEMGCREHKPLEEKVEQPTIRDIEIAFNKLVTDVVTMYELVNRYIKTKQPGSSSEVTNIQDGNPIMKNHE